MIGECAHDEFQCSDGDCIHASQVCNHIIDCTDSEDEYCGILCFINYSIKIFTKVLWKT